MMQCFSNGHATQAANIKVHVPPTGKLEVGRQDRDLPLEA